MMFVKRAVLWAALGGIAVSTVAAQSGGSTGFQCPNEKASQVDAEVTESGGSETCGIGLVVFGIGGGIFGEECPGVRAYVPAHQVCSGEKSPGTMCTKQGDLIVTAEKCGCGGLVLPIVEIGVPTSCECEPLPTGTVEDFQTVPCPEPGS
jgi:hypothetical protein